jgi:hypothetical protein
MNWFTSLFLTTVNDGALLNAVMRAGAVEKHGWKTRCAKRVDQSISGPSAPSVERLSPRLRPYLRKHGT